MATNGRTLPWLKIRLPEALATKTGEPDKKAAQYSRAALVSRRKGEQLQLLRIVTRQIQREAKTNLRPPDAGLFEVGRRAITEALTAPAHRAVLIC